MVTVNTGIIIPYRNTYDRGTSSRSINIAQAGRKSALADFMFLVIVIGAQSSFFGMVDPEWLYIPGAFDIGMILVFYSIVLLALSFKQINLISSLPGGRWVFLLAACLIIRFAVSIHVNGSVKETFTIFRYYCSPLLLLGLLVYLLGISRYRLERLLRWGFVITVLQGMFFILHHMGLNIFQAPVYSDVWEIEGQLIQRYNLAFPTYMTSVMTISAILLMLRQRTAQMVPLMIAAITMGLYATRGVLFTSIAALLFIAIAVSMRRQGGVVTSFIKIFVACVVSIGFLFLLFPQYYHFLSDRIGEVLGPEGLMGAHNYACRYELVLRAFHDARDAWTSLMGHGYVRRALTDVVAYAYKKGELSMQGDAPIAGLLYTEGFLGILLRALPFLVIFHANLRRLLTSARAGTDYVISLFIICTIAMEILGWLQTDMLRNYTTELLLIYVLEILRRRLPAKTENANNLAASSNSAAIPIIQNRLRCSER